MKGCFVLQRRYAQIGHEIVQGLMKEYGLLEACAYVQVRENITSLSEQNEVPYTALLLDEDIHRAYVNEKLDLEYLQQLERDVGNPTLWQYIAADRVIYSGQLVREYPYAEPQYSQHDLLRLTQVYARKITEFLDKEKPDFIFMPQPGGLGTLLLYHLAKKRGIKTLMIIITGLAGQTCVSDGYEKLSGVQAILSEEGMDETYLVEARKRIQEFRENPRPYSRAYDAEYVYHTRKRHFEFLTLSGLYRSIVWGAPRIFVRWLRHPETWNDYTTIQPWYYVLDRLKRKARNIIGAGDLYDAFDTSTPFAFFPLHLEPELALLVQAPFAKNQAHIIDDIAQSLPVGMVLYIKEHPQMVGYRPRAFYQALKKIPNVRLLNPSVPGVLVMQDASLVFTIAGSSGFEAVLLKKPLISFGKFYYNELSFVRRSITPEKLPELIREQLAERTSNEDELIRFVAALLKDSARVDFGYLWTYEYDIEKLKAGLSDLIRVIAQKAGLR